MREGRKEKGRDGERKEGCKEGREKEINKGIQELSPEPEID